MRSALAIGRHMSRVDYLKSNEVAEEVADRVWDHLVKNGYKNRQRKHTVQVRPSVQRRGTWTVRVMLPGVRLPERPDFNCSMRNQRDQDAAVAALKASYTDADLAKF